MAASQDETLVEMARLLAPLSRQPEVGLLFHSDRGSQHTSDAYQALLAEVQVAVSMSRTGNCYDNAGTFVLFRHSEAQNVLKTLPSRVGHKPGRPSSSTPSASTIGFDGTLL